MKPLASILCITYNQKSFIAQALDGFLMQKTDFDFEILINDDASTDGTAEIIKEYQGKYPDIIKPKFQNENQYSKGNMGLFVEFLFPRVTGKYIALCEGDDYWIDENKLQTQVDFLENNPDYALCFNRSKVIFEKHEEKDSLFPPKQEGEKFTVERLLRENYIQTNSVMYRARGYKNMRTDVMPQDWYMHLYHAQFGKIGFIDKPMSAYRRHPGGIWWDSRGRMDEIYKKHNIQLVALYDELLKMFKGKKVYTVTIHEHIRYLFGRIIEIDHSEKLQLMEGIGKAYPRLLDYFLQEQNTQFNELLTEVNRLQQLQVKSESTIRDLSEKDAQLTAIIESKTYKLARVLAYPVRTARTKDAKNKQ